MFDLTNQAAELQLHMHMLLFFSVQMKDELQATLFSVEISGGSTKTVSAMHKFTQRQTLSGKEKKNNGFGCTKLR